MPAGVLWPGYLRKQVLFCYPGLLGCWLQCAHMPEADSQVQRWSPFPWAIN